MAVDTGKEKVKVTSLISDADRLRHANEMDQEKAASMPQKRDLKKEVLGDILKRIEERNAEIKARKNAEQKA